METDELAGRLQGHVTGQEIAALGTLHEGEPFVSMVPFALLPEGAGFILHVSALASHTRDMLSSPNVSLMILAPEDASVPAQARARVTIQGDAVPIPPDTPIHAVAKRLYLERFPQSAQTFELSDFALFAIRPKKARYVGGFAQARTVTAETLAKALAR